MALSCMPMGVSGSSSRGAQPEWQLHGDDVIKFFRHGGPNYLDLWILDKARKRPIPAFQGDVLLSRLTTGCDPDHYFWIIEHFKSGAKYVLEWGQEGLQLATLTDCLKYCPENYPGEPFGPIGRMRLAPTVQVRTGKMIGEFLAEGWRVRDPSCPIPVGRIADRDSNVKYNVMWQNCQHFVDDVHKFFGGSHVFTPLFNVLTIGIKGIGDFDSIQTFDWSSRTALLQTEEGQAKQWREFVTKMGRAMVRF